MDSSPSPAFSPPPTGCSAPECRCRGGSPPPGPPPPCGQPAGAAEALRAEALGEGSFLDCISRPPAAGPDMCRLPLQNLMPPRKGVGGSWAGTGEGADLSPCVPVQGGVRPNRAAAPAGARNPPPGPEVSLSSLPPPPPDVGHSGPSQPGTVRRPPPSILRWPLGGGGEDGKVDPHSLLRLPFPTPTCTLI